MTPKTKMTIAASVCSVCAVMLAGLCGWQYFEHRIPEIDAKPASVLNIPEEQVSESVNTKTAGFTIKGKAKAAASASKYRTNYDMTIRKTPDYDGEKTGRKDKGKEFSVTETRNGSNGSIWGKLQDGNWICLSDNEYEYAIRLD